MPPPHSEGPNLLSAIEFVEQRFTDWHREGSLREAVLHRLRAYYSEVRQKIENNEVLADSFQLRPSGQCWSCRTPVGAQESCCAECGAPVHTRDTELLRHLGFLGHELKKHEKAGRLPLSFVHKALGRVNGRIVSVRRKLDQERVPLVLAASEPRGEMLPVVEEAEPAPSGSEARATRVQDREQQPKGARGPRTGQDTQPAVQNLLEVLVDPRNIQWLLVSGGVLLVLGLVIWLAAEGLFQNKTLLAGLMGAGTLAVLLGGWALVTRTRYQMAGRALTLLACLFMPFHLWFYHAQGLITLEQGQLWIPAVVCCVLYALSARVVRDPIFVPVLVLGVTGTGLLILADQGRFWEITSPCVLLIGLGLACIHVERAFPDRKELNLSEANADKDQDPPFTRQRFGLFFFFSGHVLLGLGLLLLLGAQIMGGWLYPLFSPLYQSLGVGQPAVVTTIMGRVTSLVLVLLATYAYAYSDIVVRRVGAYIYLAVFTILWSEVLLISLFDWPLHPVEAAILALAVTALLANLGIHSFADRKSPIHRVGPPLALSLCFITVFLGVVLHMRATIAGGTSLSYRIEWTYVGVMLITAISCRVGAFLYQNSEDWPELSTTYLFATAAATLVGAAGLLLVLYPDLAWHDQAWALMLIPLIYIIVARIYQATGVATARPLMWVAHTATGIMLVSSVGASFQGFLLIQGEPLNLMLALFFAEALLFYILDSAWNKNEVSVYLGTAMACAAVWQLLKFNHGVDEYFILIFAGVGLVLLVIYRLALLEDKLNRADLARAAFQCGNALLVLAFVVATLLTLGQLVTEKAESHVLVTLLSVLLGIWLVSIVLVQHSGWRRWYVVASLTDLALIVLVLAVLINLTPGQKLEVVSLTVGILLLIVGLLGWYREGEEHRDGVSLALFFGSFLVGLPLFIAVFYCRLTQPNFDTFHTLNEVGMLTAGLLMLATGFMFRIMATTLTGSFLTGLYLLGLILFIRVPERLQTTAVYIMIGGGVLFALGLLLSLYRDHLLTLPDRFRRREGIFKVLTWR